MLLRQSEVTQRYRLSRITLHRWLKDGKLTDHRIVGGHRRYDSAEKDVALYARVSAQKQAENLTCQHDMINEKVERKRNVDRAKIEQGVRMILEGIGEDPEREGLRETPQRVARMVEELFGHFQAREAMDLKWFEIEDGCQMVVLKDLPLVAFCEHHLLPFIGKAHIAYVPQERKIIGFSKIARLLDLSARYLQLQERLTAEIAESIMRRVRPQGVLVVVEAEHTCMTLRGVRKRGFSIMTVASRGLLENRKHRVEALALIRRF